MNVTPAKVAKVRCYMTTLLPKKNIPVGVEQFASFFAVGVGQGLQKSFGPRRVEGVFQIFIDAFQIVNIEVFKMGSSNDVLRKFILDASEVKLHQDVAS